SGLGTRGAAPDALAPSPEPPYFRPHMALALTPRLLRRGLELFAVISLIGVVVVLVVFGENLDAVLSALAHLRWGWLLLGLGLASMDWIGGGSRLWVVGRHGDRRWNERLGGLPHPVSDRRRSDDDVGDAPRGRAPPRGDDLHVHDLRRHRRVLRPRGAARHLPRCRPVAGAAQRGARH